MVNLHFLYIKIAAVNKYCLKHNFLLNECYNCGHLIFNFKKYLTEYREFFPSGFKLCVQVEANWPLLLCFDQCLGCLMYPCYSSKLELVFIMLNVTCHVSEPGAQKPC